MSRPGVTAAFIVCGQRHDGAQVVAAIDDMRKLQTQPPDEILVFACCTGALANCDALVWAKHQADWGHRFCEWATHMATEEWLMFVNVDDDYEPTFIEHLMHDSDGLDLVACWYDTYQRNGDVIETQAKIGEVTRGCFIVNRETALDVGYSHRHYEADGVFIEKVADFGGRVRIDPVVLFHHR